MSSSVFLTLMLLNQTLYVHKPRNVRSCYATIGYDEECDYVWREMNKSKWDNVNTCNLPLNISRISNQTAFINVKIKLDTYQTFIESECIPLVYNAPLLLKTCIYERLVFKITEICIIVSLIVILIAMSIVKHKIIVSYYKKILAK